MISYYSPIVTMSLFCTVSEILPHLLKFKEITWPRTHPIQELSMTSTLLRTAFSQRTKFEVPFFTRSKNMMRPKNLKMDHMTWPWPSGLIYHHRPVLAMTYLCRKFEDYSFSRSKDITQYANTYRQGWLEVVKVTQGHRQCRQSAHDFLFRSHGNYVSLVRFSR